MEISLEKLFKIVWKNIIIIAVASVLCSIAAFMITKYTMPKTYVSRIGFTVISTASETNVSNPSYLNSNLAYTREIIHSKIAMLDTLDYYNMVASQLNSDIDEFAVNYPEYADDVIRSKKTAAQIKNSVRFNILENTELFTVTVTTNSSGESKMIADAIEKTANVRLTQMALSDNSLAGETAVADTVRCYETPLPGVLSGPDVFMNTITGLFIGFFASFLVFLVIDLLDNRVRTLNELTEKFENIPVLGMIATFKATTKKGKEAVKK
ncbi:MAG: hypothetical protein E7588_05335 [Ruminococcaceae bacterium]|nr:hypothetical protein [Oscillospiraceae bacterium]